MNLIKICMLCFIFLTTACADTNKHQQKEQRSIHRAEKKSADKVTKSDTLKVGYTYWWPQNGPFIGNCGEKYSLVFLGTIHEIYKKTELQQYTSQTGIIRIDKVLLSKELKNNTYQKETYVSSDCFADVDAKRGDKVMVFCYEYEGSTAIPGGKSILKIDGKSDAKVRSIIKYIQSDQNPLSIEDDLQIWNQIQLGSELEQIISCKKLVAKGKL